jgi:hypothetical protein
VVENSLALASTRGPSGGMTYLKPARSTRSLAKHAVTCGASASPACDEEVRAADQTAPHDDAGLVGKAIRTRTFSVADTDPSKLRSGFRLIGEGRGAFGFSNRIRTPRPNEAPGRPIPTASELQSSDAGESCRDAWAGELRSANSEKTSSLLPYRFRGNDPWKQPGPMCGIFLSTSGT